MGLDINEFARSLINKKALNTSIKQISDDLGLPYIWTVKFANGVIKEGSAVRVQHVINKLSDKKLILAKKK